MKATAEKTEYLSITSTKPVKISIDPPKRIRKDSAFTIQADSLENGIKSYFEDRDRTNSPYNIQELAQVFGLSIRELRELKGIKNNTQTQRIIKRAFLLCETDMSNRLLRGGNSINLIFYAKNIYDWKDKQDISHEFGLTVKRIKYDTPARKVKSKVLDSPAIEQRMP